MGEGRKGKWLVAMNGREPVIGPIAVDEEDLVAIHPVIVKRSERQIIHENRNVYLIEDLVNSYENRGNQRTEQRRTRIQRSNRTETERLALAICAAAAEYRGEISVFLNEMEEGTVKDMKAFLQAILEGETNIDWGAFMHKVKKIPERRYKKPRRRQESQK